MNTEETPLTGLSAAQAAERQANGLGNKATEQPGKTVGGILAENIFTFFNLINVVLALALLLVGSYRNMLFMGTVVCNTLIGTVQELRARRTIRRLTLLQQSGISVMRDGAACKVKPEELVLGDLVILRAGDQIPADAVVREGFCGADESLLTGESDRVEKHPGDQLLSGTYVSEGRVVAQLVRVGDESYAARLNHEAKTIRRPVSRLMKDLNRLLKAVSVVLVPLGAALLVKQVLFNDPTLVQSVPRVVASMLGMIPEGLILLTSVALAVGVVRLGQREVLVQELYGIETMARVDVLCLDKTGTLTTGRMKVHELMPVGVSREEAEGAMSRLTACFDEGNSTFQALKAAFPPAQEQPVAVLPFSSKRKKSAAAFADGTVLVLGAAGFVLGTVPETIQRKIDAAAAQGLRVMVLARCRGGIDGETLPPVETVLAVLTMEDELREGCAETLKAFTQEGVTLKIISGDDPKTVSAIAGRLQVPGCEHWLDASALKDPEEITAYAEKVTVFGRVSPAQKRMLVDALKKAGHSVGMTGDGVNDIPAMKAADCSVAVRSGADAARHAAQIVMPEDGFVQLPEVVAEGRRVVGNITRAATLFLVKTVSSFVMTVVVLFMAIPYPFQPIQLTLVSMLSVGVPTFFLAMEPNRERIRGRFLPTVMKKAAPGGLAVAFAALTAMSGVHLGLTATDCSAVAAFCALVLGIVMLSRVCVPFTKVRIVVLGSVIVLSVLALLMVGSIFFVELWTFGPAEWRMTGLCMLVGLVVMALGYVGAEWVGRKLKI